MNDIAIIRKRELETITGRSYSALRRDILAGHFPKAVQIGPRAIGWRSADVRAWLDSRPDAELPPVKTLQPVL